MNSTSTQVPAELEREIDKAIRRYPSEHRRSASMPLLHLWQEHFGFISDEAIDWIAAKLGLQPINILELVTFYPMYRRSPAGRTHLRVCRTLSCAMAGGYQLRDSLARACGIDLHAPAGHDIPHCDAALGAVLDRQRPTVRTPCQPASRVLKNVLGLGGPDARVPFSRRMRR